MREWLEVLVTESGLVVAQQTIQRPPLMVAQMTEEWLNYYRKIAQSNTVPGGFSQMVDQIHYFSSSRGLNTGWSRPPLGVLFCSSG